jgi:predicted Zn-dependent protease
MTRLPWTLALLALGLSTACLRPAAAGAETDPLLEALVLEAARTLPAWADEEDPPYYIAYRAVESEIWRVKASGGALTDSHNSRRHVLDVGVRAGTRQVDSTHRLRDTRQWNRGGSVSVSLPQTQNVNALRAVVWAATEPAVEEARERLHKVHANRRVKVIETDPSPDFNQRAPHTDLQPRVALQFDNSVWEDRLVALSTILDDSPVIYRSSAEVMVQNETHLFVDTEEAELRYPRSWARIALSVETTADDGMEVRLYRWMDVRDPQDLPDQAELVSWAHELVRDVEALRIASLGEPYTGPVLLRGKAAGVFIHEVLGHRAEGHRQKDEEEGQTFRGKIGQQVAPEFLTIYDDPSVANFAGQDLNGHYAFDQEGQPGQRASLVEDGVFTGFLMSRSPIEGFSQSNGHGRAQTGRAPVARMANTIVQAATKLTHEDLRQELKRQLAEQDLAWGLEIAEIGGGFTLTGRTFPNAFNVRATYAWKVFADGRPDELVRGIDLVGTPLVALSQIIAAGGELQVFNGFCGAESGSVPNSAVSPSLLLSKVEVQRKEKDQDRPPLLPKPGQPGSDS